MKYRITQFVLVLSLFCNPMAGFAVAVADISDLESSAMTQMPCHTNTLQSQSTNHNTVDEEDCTMDCCNTDDGCKVDQSCQSCLNLHFVNAMLLETCEICFSYPLQRNLEVDTIHVLDRPILPEIQPPALLNLS